MASRTRLKVCDVLHCKNTSETGVPLFQFPVDRERCKLWNTSVLWKDSTRKMKYACRIHFSIESFSDTFKRRLHRYAVPTIQYVSDHNVDMLELDFATRSVPRESTPFSDTSVSVGEHEMSPTPQVQRSPPPRCEIQGFGQLKRVAFPTLNRPKTVPSKKFHHSCHLSSSPITPTSDPQIPFSAPEISNVPPSSVRSSFNSDNGHVDLIRNHHNVAEECTFEEGQWKQEIKEECLLEEEVRDQETVECEPFAFVEVSPKDENTGKGFQGFADEDPLGI